ncbi:hypothetical protein GOB93_10850 [Acetobacter musti]|uniref:Uncharacterized protein n=1 Tax=Acetobacter musti TaxID=864732 RepID=A0ABX0JQP6_9PROT|nr:hypothetical protein [Acetobacter musti]NHN85137.1 hypothetical protein [Acetobacter musti]
MSGNDTAVQVWRDVEMTDAEWQTICEGYHALMAFIPAESDGKQISITIHRVS